MRRIPICIPINVTDVSDWLIGDMQYVNVTGCGLRRDSRVSKYWRTGRRVNGLFDPSRRSGGDVGGAGAGVGDGWEERSNGLSASPL